MAKIIKDIAQAESIIEILLEDNPGSLILAADALKARADLLSINVSKGIKQLSKDIKNALGDAVDIPEFEWDTRSGTVKLGQ